MSALLSLKKSQPALDLPWSNIRDVWLSGQVGLPQVTRWSKHLKEGVRPQDSLQHSYSVTILGFLLVEMLRPHVALDGQLLSLALSLHDHGEGELKEDTLYIDKTDHGDLDEYRAFRRRYEQLDPVVFARFEEAFLLQFAGRDKEVFPPHARSVMGDLRSRHPLEILAFEATERWDYLLYPLEQWEELRHAKVLVQVLRNQHHHLDRLAQDLPGFSQEVWTPEVAAWSQAFLQKYEGQWIEQKGEK